MPLPSVFVRLATLAGCVLLLSWTGAAAAYCRTTTCDPSVSCSQAPEDCCVLDGLGCDTNGIPLAWPTSCVSYSTHNEGSTLREVSPQQLRTILDDSYSAWMSSDCGGSALSLAVEDRGLASCGSPEFNEGDDAKNANVWMFRDDLPVDGTVGGSTVDASALAVSIVSYDFTTGEIVDVDVELNSGIALFTTSDDPSRTVIDLQSVVTHEAGHFLGLDHSREPGATPTMRAGYVPGDLGPRTLDPDDEAGLCAAYPEDRPISSKHQTCEPRGGYSGACYEEKGCGCSAAGTDGQGSSGWLSLLTLLGLAGWRLRRRSEPGVS